MQAHLDCNASIMSVKIYKQLWVEDYYLFYMDVVALDGSCESRPMKRYSVPIMLCRTSRHLTTS